MMTILDGELGILVRRYRANMRHSARAWRRTGSPLFIAEARRERDLAAALLSLVHRYGPGNPDSYRHHHSTGGIGLCRPAYVPPCARPQPAHA